MVSAVLDRPTLVLNRSWQPVGVAPVSPLAGPALERQRPRRRSAGLPALLVGRLGTVDSGEDEPFIQAVRMRLRVPEVVP